MPSGLYMCPGCLKVYDIKQLKSEMPIILYSDSTTYYHAYISCPDITCDSGGYDSEGLFEIDELMIEPISILNRCGYKTKFCCSGHTYTSQSESYIYFESEEYMPQTLPKNWSKDNSKPIIRANIKGKTILERRKSISNNINSLLQWCVDLEKYTF